jgi:hypothetical protein
MGRQWMIAGLVEECGFLGCRFWKVAIAASIARRFHSALLPTTAKR